MDIITIMQDLLHHHGSLQEVVNRRFHSDHEFILDSDEFGIIENRAGVKFYVNEDIQSVIDVKKDYRFNDVRKDDIVIDIGANVGGFSLRVAKYVSRVYAFEPVKYLELEKNIELNEFNNIFVNSGALSKQEFLVISYGGTTVRTLGLKFKDILKIAGGQCDFLKCDCEGYEWIIPHDELAKVRGIEMELHRTNDQTESLVNDLKRTHRVELTPIAGFGYAILHARMKP